MDLTKDTKKIKGGFAVGRILKLETVLFGLNADC